MTKEELDNLLIKLEDVNLEIISYQLSSDSKYINDSLSSVEEAIDKAIHILNELDV